MNRPIFALIFPLGGPGVDNELPPGFNYPSHGLPGSPGSPSHPISGGGEPSHPIVIPPGAIAPGTPTQPIYIGGSPSHPIAGQPGAPSHPIVYPPGIPDQGLPPTAGLPPLVPAHPITGVPPRGQVPVDPGFGVGGGGGTLPSHGEIKLPEGSVLLIPVPTDANKPTPLPPGVPTGSVPVIAWYGRGTLPTVCWLPAQAAPKA